VEVIAAPINIKILGTTAAILVTQYALLAMDLPVTHALHVIVELIIFSPIVQEDTA